MTEGVPAQASEERLTEVLRRVGLLSGNGRVAEVAVEASRTTLVSKVARLCLSYTGDAGTAPSHLFLKAQRADLAGALAESGRRECEFYATVAPTTPEGLLPRCYEAVASAGVAWHLLMEDLTATHEAPVDWPVPPTVENGDRIIEAHARFHAHWWDHPTLGVSVGHFTDVSGALEGYWRASPRTSRASPTALATA